MRVLFWLSFRKIRQTLQEKLCTAYNISLQKNSYSLCDLHETWSKQLAQMLTLIRVIAAIMGRRETKSGVTVIIKSIALSTLQITRAISISVTVSFTFTALVCAGATSGSTISIQSIMAPNYSKAQWFDNQLFKKNAMAKLSMSKFCYLHINAFGYFPKYLDLQTCYKIF